jgi:Cu-Zn family superoxide dismutase
MRRTYLVTGLAALAAFAGSPIAPAATAGDADRDVRRTFILSGECVYPEGIAVYGRRYYVGSTCNGQMYRGNLSRRRAHVWIPAAKTPYEVLGIDATRTRVVAARGKGHASVYDRLTGRRIAEFSDGLGYDSNVNDVAIAPNGAAYLTDLQLSRIYRIPAAAIAHRQAGVQHLHVFLNLKLRPHFRRARPGSANGIEVTPDGRFLIVAHYHAGKLYRIRISNGHVDRIRLHGKTLSGPDGIVLKGHLLYVVEFAKSRIAKITLSNHYTSGRIESRTTNTRFQCPTGADLAGDRLLVVNSQYCGPGEPPFTVVSIPAP